jgi:hypothetical protein
MIGQVTLGCWTLLQLGVQLVSSYSEPSDSAHPQQHLPCRMIVHFKLIVFDQLEPPSLPHVQFRLGKDLLQAFVVRIDMNHIPMQIVSPCSQ